VWSFEHSVQCPVRREFAWKFWTKVANWPVVDPAVETVTLDGDFAAGTTITTKPRDMEVVKGRLVEVQEGSRAVVEVVMPDAYAKFFWTFADSETGTRITQRVSIEGARGDEYQSFGEELEKGIPQGMQRLADAITEAAKSEG
jgi:hypothetical protein